MGARGGPSCRGVRVPGTLKPGMEAQAAAVTDPASWPAMPTASQAEDKLEATKYHVVRSSLALTCGNKGAESIESCVTHLSPGNASFLDLQGLVVRLGLAALTLIGSLSNQHEQ